MPTSNGPPSDERPASADGGPRKLCDLVMKGGITSGVVYPEAVLKLHERYDFRCIGGASAGAIAAAATAAAQFGEPTPGATAPAVGGAATPGAGERGFAGLRALNEGLRRPGKLIELFQPTAAARPLLEVFLAGLRGAHRASGWRSALAGFLFALAAAVVHLPAALLVGALAGLGTAFALASLLHGSARAAPLVCVLFGAAGALLGASVQLLGILFRVLPRQGFGICRLHLPESHDPAAVVPLTDWLFRRFDRIAGVEGPLTFGDLQRKEVRLELITTNLSELRPYVLPFEGHRFLFKVDEFEVYFPRYVVEHLRRTSHAGARVHPPAGFCFLPPAADLPIGVGVRLSLSFPVLISAVPLYSIRADAFRGREDDEPLHLAETDLKKNWFSDGGICSNFPIHFFDHWLPTRPTFGISLGSKPADQVAPPRHALEGMSSDSRVEQRKTDAVHLPRADRPEAAAWHDLNGLFDLFTSMFDTMMDYRDTMQSELPGFRERIVEIRLDPSEGGLNLDMDPARIAGLADKGKEAGEVLLREFDFEVHRWVRLQVLMPPLADELLRLRDQRIALGGWPDKGRPYVRGPQWQRVMEQVLDTLAGLAGTVPPGAAAAAGPGPLSILQRADPKPPATLRAAPRI